MEVDNVGFEKILIVFLSIVSISLIHFTYLREILATISGGLLYGKMIALSNGY